MQQTVNLLSLEFIGSSPFAPTNIYAMKVLLKRIAKRATYTIGKMYIDGDYFCDTLEDTDRGLKQSMLPSTIRLKKVPNRTAIPTGTYNIVLNMSPKFKRVLPRLLDVPEFDGILIHRGNTDRDTSGCILVGENKEVGKVINSTGYETRLIAMLSKAQASGETLTIEIA